MSCIADLLRNLSFDVEKQLKPNLQGLTGLFVRGYLPQAWVFRTETETVTFRVDFDGNASVSTGQAASPDVTIETSHAVLSAALRTRDRAAVPAGPLRVTPNTSKGRTAFGYLRGQLGL